MIMNLIELFTERVELFTERSRSMGSYFRLPLPIFFADVFSLVEPDDHAKKDFRSSRAADFNIKPIVNIKTQTL